MATNQEDKRKYLEFIQNIITRLNTNSFLIKGWATTIFAAVIALFASTKNDSFIYLTGIPIFIFWYLDTVYLQTERKYRVLYGEAVKDNTTLLTYDLKLDKNFIKNDEYSKFWVVFFSKTICLFYLFLLIIGVLGIIFIKTGEENNEVPTKVEVTSHDTLKVQDINAKIRTDTFVIQADTTSKFTVDTAKD